MGKKLVHPLLAELFKRGEGVMRIVEILVIFYNWIWNCTKYTQRSAGIAGTIFTQDKDDRVDSIYAKPRCDKASNRGKHSNIRNFL